MASETIAVGKDIRHMGIGLLFLPLIVWLVIQSELAALLAIILCVTTRAKFFFLTRLD